MPRRASALIPPDLRSRLEAERLDTLALLRALDQAFVLPAHLPQPHTQQLFELDADCAEALWALEQPSGSLDLRARVTDTLASLHVLKLEKAIRASLHTDEAYNDLPQP